MTPTMDTLKAMVLSAGEGRRLRPLTVYWAKPAIPLLGATPIEYAVGLLREAGIREVVVNLHHNPESIVEALEAMDQGQDFALHYSREAELLGTAGGLKQAEELLAGGSFVVLNGDTIVDLDLGPLIDWHRDKKAAATLLLRPRPARSDYTELGIAEDGRVVSIGQRSHESSSSRSPLMFAGVWVLEPSVFEHLHRGQFARLEVDLLPKLIVEGSVFGYVADATWFDIGTPERYLNACEQLVKEGLFERQWRVRSIEPPSDSPPGTAVLVGPGTRVDPGARFSGTTILGADCVVERGARIQSAVLWDRVTVGGDALIRKSVVASDVSLAASTTTVGKVVARIGSHRATIRAREVVGDHVVAEIKG